MHGFSASSELVLVRPWETGKPCLLWLQVGSLSPGIEVWDMDVLDAVEPIITLGGELPGSFSGAQQEEASGAGSMKAMKQKKAKVPARSTHLTVL